MLCILNNLISKCSLKVLQKNICTKFMVNALRIREVLLGCKLKVARRHNSREMKFLQVRLWLVMFSQSTQPNHMIEHATIFCKGEAQLLMQRQYLVCGRFKLLEPSRLKLTTFMTETVAASCSHCLQNQP